MRLNHVPSGDRKAVLVVKLVCGSRRVSSCVPISHRIIPCFSVLRQKYTALPSGLGLPHRNPTACTEPSFSRFPESTAKEKIFVAAPATSEQKRLGRPPV